MKIRIEGYPCTINFRTNTKLPRFKCGCKVRTKIAQDKMKKRRILSPNHDYSDYIVEEIRTNGTWETWYLGS